MSTPDNRWTRIDSGPRKHHSLYRCVCGTEREVYDASVRTGRSTSCGCRKSERLSIRNRAKPRLLKEPTALALAWAAGFWDGEGSSCGTTRGGRFQPRVSVSQSGSGAPAILARFQEAVGGLGHISGPVTRTLSSGNPSLPIYRWHAESFEECQAVIAFLWNHLSDVKREQAATVLKKVAA